MYKAGLKQKLTPRIEKLYSMGYDRNIVLKDTDVEFSVSEN